MHGTQKPVEAMRRPMLNNSAPGQPVYEPFSGSGTSIIAAETCGRISLSMELDPAYVDVAVERWQSLHRRDRDPRRRRPQLRRDCRREEPHHEPRPPPEADGDPQARGQPRQARLEPRRADAAGHPAALPRASLRGRPQGVAAGGAHPLRDGRADQHRPRRARRLLPGLRPLGRGRGEAEGEPGALQDRLGLRAAAPLDHHRQQAARADGPLHDRARHDPGGALPGGRPRPAPAAPGRQPGVPHRLRDRSRSRRSR